MPSNTVKTFVVNNTGVGPLKITSLNFVGGNSSDYSFINPPSVPFTVTPSGSITFSVQFTPSAIGSRSTTIVLASNDFDEDYYQYKIEGNGLSTVGLNEVANEIENVILFPNPTNEMATLKINSEKAEHVTVTIIDIQGKQVMQLEKDIAKGEQLINIQTTTLSNGNYFVKTKVGTKSSTIKMVVAH
ncbi:MAG: choice-of-anchor D domain-containing protein [Sphingobacteriaceae bacterium]|nr:choice-of-anchor D domain-containing protein [Sphingobacteriaceae bacterium]